MKRGRKWKWKGKEKEKRKEKKERQIQRKLLAHSEGDTQNVKSFCVAQTKLVFLLSLLTVHPIYITLFTIRFQGEASPHVFVRDINPQGQDEDETYPEMEAMDYSNFRPPGKFSL